MGASRTTEVVVDPRHCRRRGRLAWLLTEKIRFHKLTRTMTDGTQRKVLTKYEGYGLVGGFAAGLLLGVMMSGPHLREWPAWQSLSVILGGAGLGSFTGYLALAIVMGSLAGGSVGGTSIGGGESSQGRIGHKLNELFSAAGSPLDLVALVLGPLVVPQKGLADNFAAFIQKHGAVHLPG